MLSKLFDIEKKSHKRIEKRLKPIKNNHNKSNNNFSKTNYSVGKSLIHNITLTNENKSLHRRIHQKCSIYSISKWDEEYKKSQEYKKNLCQYPSIDFCNFTISSVKSHNKLGKQRGFNIFNEIRFRPFISFDSPYKKNKSENKYNRNQNNNKNNKSNNKKIDKNYFYLYDDDRDKKQ